ncbi:SDR family oxidoreductase [Moorena producens]|uniref:SDR family oxidoreductase n=1 Tax=Moorena producens TaxID=1155739 RepID=UPI0013BD9696|nr:SDR family oxidoreductase [Moorena sp. SIO2I5]
MTERKVAIVTAAGRGIGAACARELWERGYSLSLMSVSENAVQLAEELGGLGLQGSVTNKADLKTLVDKTFERYGHIDAVVNNTGHPAKGDLLQLTDEQWYEGFNLIVLSVVHMAQLITPIMFKQGGGAIVNISSYAAVEPSLGRPVSSTIRAALDSFTKLYADRYAQNNIRMNCILPGFIDNYPVDNDIFAAIPMQRQAKLTEIAKTVAFLLSADAGYITGQNLRVDGGLTRSL